MHNKVIKIALFVLLALCIKLALAHHPDPWSDVGETIKREGPHDYYSMAIDPQSGIPYLAYSESPSNQQLTVKKYDSGKWVPLGDTKDIWAFEPNIVISASGIPYVSYCDGLDEIAVMRYDGKQWIHIGDTGVHSCVSGHQLAIDQLGTPYLVYEKYNNGAIAAVIKYDEDSGSWVPVGDGTTPLEANLGKKYMALSKSGQLYLAFLTADCNLKVLILNKGWQPLGEDSLPKQRIFSANLALDNKDNPYIVYKDFNNQISVIKFSEARWSLVGHPEFARGESLSPPNLTFDRNNTPYLSFPWETQAWVMKFDGNQWKNYGSPVAKNVYISSTTIVSALNKLYLTYYYCSDDFLSNCAISVISRPSS